MLTEYEKWHFDLLGYIVLKGAVPQEDVKRMVELCDTWHALPDSELRPPLQSYRDPETHPTLPRSINNAHYGDEVFQRLALNREIMRCVLALTGNSPQLLAVSLTRNTKASDDVGFHGGFSGGLRNPANDYQAADGQVLATFLNAAVSLVDVPIGAGFVCVPGSHKSHFPKPPDIDIYSDPPAVVNVTPKAGDVVLFTEALCHGARPWPLDDPRRTVFVRYSTSYASWSPGIGPIEEHRDKLSDDLCELLQVAGFQHRKQVVTKLLAEFGEESG
ncbi:phytanoyl-CoA dioxygenase family protein [Candidatus Poribacteria bacterium]|nr:phytanoyl-CoA dioxygenase family protein [Candidatus Poribacteria bacterium]